MSVSDVFNDLDKHLRELFSSVGAAVRAKSAGKADYSDFEAKLAKVQADLAKLRAEVYK